MFECKIKKLTKVYFRIFSPHPSPLPASGARGWHRVPDPPTALVIATTVAIR